MAINHDFEQAWDYTIKGNSVMVVSDGSSVVGQGDLGTLASLPALEAKCVFLHKLAGIDAFPLPVDLRDPAEIAEAVALCSSVFAGIHLSDISAPRCFEVQRLLDERLDIPVFHDDQQGTAAAVLAALSNGLSVAGKRLADATVVVAGLGPGGQAVVRLLVAAEAGPRDRLRQPGRGARRPRRPRGRPGLGGRQHQPRRGERRRGLGAEGRRRLPGPLDPGAPVGRRRARHGARPGGAGARDARPGDPARRRPRAWPASTPRAGPTCPNQINSGLASPGIWRGALDCRATEINQAMTLAAATAIAETAAEDSGLSEVNVVPSIFNARLVPNVAAAVRAAAEATGVARVTAGVGS